MIRRSTLLVLVVFVILVGVLLYLQNREPSGDALLTATPEDDRALDITADQVTGLKVISAEGSIFHASRIGSENWTLVQPDLPGQLDNAQLESDLTQLLNLTPLSRLETGLGLEALGLITPQYSIRISQVGGGETLMEVGGKTPTASGYYMRIDNTDLIVVPSYSLDSILKLADEPPFVPTPTPELTPTVTDQASEEAGETSIATSTPEL